MDVGYGAEQEFVRTGSVSGTILLVHSDIGSTWADLFNEYLKPPDIIARAIKGGAAAILWMAARERLLLYRHTNTLDGKIDKIPQAVVAREDAMRLARAVAAHAGLRVHFRMPNKIGVPVEQVRIRHGDTAGAPYAGMAGGSKTTFTVGPAVQRAAAD